VDEDIFIARREKYILSWQERESFYTQEVIFNFLYMTSQNSFNSDIWSQEEKTFPLLLGAMTHFRIMTSDERPDDLTDEEVTSYFDSLAWFELNAKESAKAQFLRSITTIQYLTKMRAKVLHMATNAKNLANSIKASTNPSAETLVKFLAETSIQQWMAWPPKSLEDLREEQNQISINDIVWKVTNAMTSGQIDAQNVIVQLQKDEDLSSDFFTEYTHKVRNVYLPELRDIDRLSRILRIAHIILGVRARVIIAESKWDFIWE
jgi:hypothetical protein